MRTSVSRKRSSGICLPLILLGTVWLIKCLGAQPLDVKKILPGDARGWKAAARHQTFTRDTVAQYLYGAAEICLAFDFKKLTVQEYAKSGGPSIVIEIYEMDSAEDAFGLFSHDRKGEPASVGNESLYGLNTLRFWKGKVFVRLSVEKETPEAKKAVFALADKIANVLPKEGKKPEIAVCFPTVDLLPNSLHYFHKQVSLNNFIYFGDENILDLNEKTEAAIAQFVPDGQKVRALICLYPGPEDARRAFKAVLAKFFGGAADKGTTIVKKMDKERYGSARLMERLIIFISDAKDKKTCEVLADRIVKKAKEVLFPGP
ncbi:MAG: DUF6599 family protein [Candidatus Aminicenantales bacterium]